MRAIRISLAVTIALMVGLALPPGPARAFNNPGAFDNKADQFRGGFDQKGRPDHVNPSFGHRRALVHDGSRTFLNCQVCHRTSILPQINHLQSISSFGFVPQLVWVPGFWWWDGFQWVWAPGHWTWDP